MNKQHKWHKEIKAWADGAEIEVLDTDGVYRVVHKPNWGVSGAEFRIKPQPKEPQYLYFYCNFEDNEIKISNSKLEKLDLITWYPIGKIKLETEETK